MGLFGTDGIRGRAGEGMLAPEPLRALGQAFGSALGGGVVAVARDPRESGAAFRSLVLEGLRASGLEVRDLGVLPTPALSWAIAADGALVGGVMITASHNPWYDNGLKFFGGDGKKASDALQERTESLYEELSAAGLEGGAGLAPPASEDSDRVGNQVRQAYLETLRGPRIDRLLVYDDAAGAAAGLLLEALGGGADRIAVAGDPDGRNINEGVGAVYPEAARLKVLDHGAWAGFVVDGDGDRIMLIDERGTVHDGDAILGFLADRMQTAGTLTGGAVVGTVTTNGGLESYLAHRGLSLVRTPVGDRHVAAAMREHGCNLGGEASGHVLTPDLCPTGDGIRVGLQVLRAADRMDRPLSELLGAVPKFPSARREVPDGGRRPSIDRLLDGPELRPAFDRIAAGGGRPLVRYSGTEPYLRILVEGPSTELVESWANELAAAARAVLGG
jgi:phosphoglucosamine mutase